MPSNTAAKLTQQNQKANFFETAFELPNSQIARSGLLERIKFEQWHIFPTMRAETKNINLINLASLLAAFPRMGIYCYEISQSQIAEKMADLFGGPVPARNTISKYENELMKLGYLEIPKHVDWRRAKTKVRLFTKKFWNMARRGLEPLSYTCPHVTFLTGKVERVEQVYSPKEHIVNYETKIHARETISKNVEQPARVVPVNKITGRKKFQRPPKNNTSQPKQLNKFENSISHWLFQNRNVESYREAVLIFSLFLRIVAHDDFCQQLRKNWRDCTDASRPGMVTGLISYLRAYCEPSPANPAPITFATKPAPVPKPITSEEIDNPERHALRLSFFFGVECHGKYSAVAKYFKNADRDEQAEMVERFTGGEWP